MLNQITIDPKICHGKPCIAGTRIPVDVILDLLANGYTFDRIIKECYPYLTIDQLKAVVLYANLVIKNEEVFPLEGLKHKKATKV